MSASCPGNAVCIPGIGRPPERCVGVGIGQMLKGLLGGLALSVLTAAAGHAPSVKVAIIATLSGPQAALGEQLRDGFALAGEPLGGTLGGPKPEITLLEDGPKPGPAGAQDPRPPET